MAGIYIHIPFCRSRCIYCGFYSTTHSELRRRYVDALCKEYALRKGYLDERVRTIYIGGGTPSQLDADELRQLFGVLPTDAEEGTIECNPDDLTDDYAELLAQLPVNRVSMGAQTFSDERLRFLRRRHTASQIAVAVERLRRVGIGNISVDLMYGFPGETLADWRADIEQALALGVEHLSAYGLMYEEGTPLYQLLQTGRVAEVDEELSRQMYYDLKDRLEAAGYEHYEISNFARTPEEGGARSEERGASFRSVHNSGYWNQTPYLGLGAAAHSFDGRSRQWNPDDLVRYMEAVERGAPVFEREVLDEETAYNELIMTRLRTSDGLPLELLTAEQRTYCLRLAEPFLADGLLVKEKDHLRLSRRGLYVSDMVMSELMKV